MDVVAGLWKMPSKMNAPRDSRGQEEAESNSEQADDDDQKDST